MSIDSVAGLLESLRQARLLPPAHLEQLPALQGRFVEPRALARELLQRGWLTPYQINQLFQGHGSSLIVGQYLLLERLGEGGMGQVFKARHQRLQRVVALKLIRKDRLANPDAVQRFQREARAAARLSHPNIVTLYDADEAAGTHFFAMEYVEGTDLARLVKERGPLPVPQACAYVCQAALGLQHAHEQGLVHRDIKPANLFLTARGVVKILDMGLARLHGPLDEAGDDTDPLTREGSVMGTPDYLAPEQALDTHKADIRADLYSLGCTLYYLLTGRVVFPGGTLAEKITRHMSAEPTPVEQLRPEVPRGVRDILRKLLAKRADQRFQTPAELAAALAPFSGAGVSGTENLGETVAYPLKPEADQSTLGTGVTVGPQPPAPTYPLARVYQPRENFFKRHRLALALGGAALLAGMATLFLVFGFHKDKDPDDQNEPGELARKYTNRLGMEFVLVPRGTFLMGGGGGMVGDKEVEIRYDFYLGKYEVTQGEWETVTSFNPSCFSRSGAGRNEVANIATSELKRFPVESVSWEQAQLFIKRLNHQAEEPGWVYRLPTEVEWEYACRDGPLGDKLDCAFSYYFDKPTNELLPEQANFDHKKGLKRTCKVGSYKPNRLGLYDMHGNVWEWCDDEVLDPDDPKGASLRVSRGGTWANPPGVAAAANHYRDRPTYRSSHVGLRLARVPVGKKSK
jgi:serine/threonine protein kinase